MPLSSSVVIHFTKEKLNLVGILKNNFNLNYCKETITLKNTPTSFLVPMVSFCDIPLSEIKNHIQKYGNYGIGLTKEWASRNGLNPVLYIEANSSLSKSYHIALKTFISGSNNNLTSITEGQKALFDVFRYIKNYQSDLERKGTVMTDYRYSDEREWRYVPSYQEKCMMALSEELYNTDRSKYDDQLKPLKLEFTPNDIKYIIIDKDEEISEFVGYLREAKATNYTYHDVERLTTRILTTEQIMNDI